MAQHFSEKDLKLLGYDCIVMTNTNHWRVYEAIEDSLGVRATIDNFLFFPTGTTNAHIDVCKRNITYKDYYVLTPPSSVNALRKSYPEIKTVDDLIVPRLKNIFDNYTKGLKQYISDKLPPSEIYIKSTLHSTLLQSLNPKKDDNRIHIITADAATGKTRLVREVVSKMIDKKNKFITIYIEIDQIAKLTDYQDLWSLIKSQLLVAHLDESLFKHGLEQGYFVFIFDGFDELCTKGHSNLSVEELLEWFIGIVVVKGSRCKIAITSRKSFWNSEININTRQLEHIKVHELDSFSQEQAKDYFRIFFQNNVNLTQFNSALNIYNTLLTDALGNEIPFIKLPSSVALIADSVENNVRDVTQLTQDTPIIAQFLLYMLDREGQRHQLSTLPETQLAAFTDIAVSYFPNDSFEIDDLFAAGFEEADKDSGSLNHHPFITGTHNGKYEFHFALLELYFVSVFLHSEFNDGVINQDFLRIIRSEIKGEGALLDMFVSLLDNDFDFKKAHNNAHNAVKSFLFHAKRKRDNTRKNERETINFFNELSNAKRKTNNVNNTIDDLYIEGDIVAMDFSNTTLKDCTFKNVNFKKCRGQSTLFENCEFIGNLEFDNNAQYIKNWMNIQRKNCNFDEVAESFWRLLPDITNTLDIRDRKKILKTTFSLILKQFFNNEKHIRDMSENALKMNGVIKRSPYTDIIIEVMLNKSLLLTRQEARHRNTLYELDRGTYLASINSLIDEGSMQGDLSKLYNTIDARVFNNNNN